MAWFVRGITWSFRSSHCLSVPTFFIRSFGIVQILSSKSISAHLVPTASLGLTIVCNCHLIKICVGIAMLAPMIASIKIGKSLGSNDGLCVVVGALNFPLRWARGLSVMNSSLIAKAITSLIRWHKRLTNSNEPFASSGFIASATILGFNSLIGRLPSCGKIWFSSEFQISLEVSGLTFALCRLSSIHSSAMRLNVLSFCCSDLLSCSFFHSLGSTLLASSVR